MQFTHWVTSLEVIYQDYTQLPLEPQQQQQKKKALLKLLFFSTHAVVLPNTCKHILMGEIGGVAL